MMGKATLQAAVLPSTMYLEVQDLLQKLAMIYAIVLQVYHADITSVCEVPKLLFAKGWLVS